MYYKGCSILALIIGECKIFECHMGLFTSHNQWVIDMWQKGSRL